MDTILKVNVDDIDARFVEDLKKTYSHAAVEIRIQEQPDAAASFGDAEFWAAIALLAWSQEGDDDNKQGWA